MGSLCSTSGVLFMTFLLFSFVLIDHGAVSSYSSYDVCGFRLTKRIIVKDSETFFMPAKELMRRLEITSKGSPSKASLDLSFYPFSDFQPNVIQDSNGNSWLPIKIIYTTRGLGTVSWEVQGPNPIRRTYNSRFFFSMRRHPLFTITFSSEVRVAKMCNSTTTDLNPPASSSTSFESWLSGDDEDSDELLKDSWDDDKDFMDDFGNIQNKDRDYVPRHYSTSFRGGHIIFIPVGAIIFLLSVCLRCCLCRKQKTVVQRVRTIAVVRRVPVSSSDFVQVSQASATTQPTSANPMDLPPSYADVESELPPPSYEEIAREVDDQQQALRTEVTLKNEKADEETGLTAETATAPAQAPPAAPDAEGTEGGIPSSSSRSSLARVFNASAMSLRSQFAFKPMKEEQ